MEDAGLEYLTVNAFNHAIVKALDSDAYRLFCYSIRDEVAE